MNQTETIYDIVLGKISANGVTLLKDTHPRTCNVSQKAKINDTQLVLSYEYYCAEPDVFTRVNRMSVGYINTVTGRYKPVSSFYSEQRTEIMKTILKFLHPTSVKTPELDLIRKLANNQYIQKTK